MLEGSGKWPNDDVAFRKMKAALGCELAQALTSSYGLEVRACEEYIDVFVDGFALRLILWSDRDEALVTKTSRVRPFNVLWVTRCTDRPETPFAALLMLFMLYCFGLSIQLVHRTILLYDLGVSSSIVRYLMPHMKTAVFPSPFCVYHTASLLCVCDLLWQAILNTVILCSTVI